MNNIELILLYCSAVTDLLYSENQKYQSEKFSALKTVAGQVIRYEEQYPTHLLEEILKKKLRFILDAKSISELNRILSGKDFRPEYRFNDTWSEPQFHIPEEELLMWFSIISDVPIRDYAAKRVLELGKRIGLGAPT
jgi:hypothetical protein